MNKKSLLILAAGLMLGESMQIKAMDPATIALGFQTILKLHNT